MGIGNKKRKDILVDNTYTRRMKRHDFDSFAQMIEVQRYLSKGTLHAMVNKGKVVEDET